MPSTCPHGLHVAIAMDGNGRWAGARGLPRLAGHRAGVDAVRRVVAAAPSLGIGTLTLFAFSSANWRRPLAETTGILRLIARFLRQETRHAIRRGVRIRIVGRRGVLPEPLATAVADAEEATARGSGLLLQVAIDYSGRDAILAAAARIGARGATRADFSRELGTAGDVDLCIRTGGEMRLSDFLLWECAYAELVFTRTPWPDFDGRALAAAVAAYRRRTRTFGALAAVRA
jgi:undecaprenyl diphosphate synthase